MTKKRIIVLLGTAVVITALLSGIAYAWFSDAQEETGAIIDAGRLGIGLELTQADTYALYPQLTSEIRDDDGDLQPDPADLDNEDVARATYTLTNKYNRGVMVRVPLDEWIGKVVVKGSLLKEDSDFLDYDPESGDLQEDILKEANDPALDALKIVRKVTGIDVEGALGTDVAVSTYGENHYIYLPPKGAAEIALTMWIDGKTGGNEFQNASIEFGMLEALATQYRHGAIMSTFELEGYQMDELMEDFASIPLE